jgi:Undecaprenyl-phosphate galactose phosphotransferase WbaP
MRPYRLWGTLSSLRHARAWWGAGFHPILVLREKGSSMSQESGLSTLEVPRGGPRDPGERPSKTTRWRRVWRPRLVVATLIFSDVLLALLIWNMAILVKQTLFWGPEQLTAQSAAAIVPAVAVWVGVRALSGLYSVYGIDSVEELRRHTYTVFATLAILAIFALGLKVGHDLSRLLLGLFFLGLLLAAPFARYFVKLGLRKVGLWGKPVMIFGSGQNEGRVRRNLARLLQEEWELGYNPVAQIDCRLTPLAQPARPYPIHQLREAPLWTPSYSEILANAAELAREQGVDTAILAMPHTPREQLAEIVSLLSMSFRHVLVIPDLAGVTNSAVVARQLGDTLAVEVRYNLLSPWALRAKRLIDLVATLIGGTLILPLVLALGLLIYLQSGGPVLYRDQRMGRDGSLFWCVKFRTMVPDAEVLLQRVLHEDAGLREEYAKYHKLRDDPRVTSVGRFLRTTSLDELPQLWNVLRGEMSLVGPRPYLPRESEEIGITQSEILRVLPGITGPWQVAGRNHTSFGERVNTDAYYIRDWSIWLDLVLLARTLKMVVVGRGAY